MTTTNTTKKAPARSRAKTTATGEPTTVEKAKAAGLAVPTDMLEEVIDYNKHPEKLEYWGGMKDFPDVSRVNETKVGIAMSKFAKYFEENDKGERDLIDIDPDDEQANEDFYVTIANLIDAAAENLVIDRGDFLSWVRKNEDGDMGAVNIISIYLNKLGE